MRIGRACAEFAAAHGVRLYLQPGGCRVGAAARSERASGCTTGCRISAWSCEFAPTDFIQINATVNQALVARAVELLELTPAAAVLDLFCGLGNFTLRARASRRQRRGSRGRGRAGRARPRQRAPQRHRQRAVPSRRPRRSAGCRRCRGCARPIPTCCSTRRAAGAPELLAALARLAPQRVLYISCHPGSLARDLGVLVHEHGFKLDAAGVVDMFPHTAHVESLALLTADPRDAALPAP